VTRWNIRGRRGIGHLELTRLFENDRFHAFFVSRPTRPCHGLVVRITKSQDRDFLPVRA
jgi:hypothetical protein